MLFLYLLWICSSVFSLPSTQNFVPQEGFEFECQKVRESAKCDTELFRHSLFLRCYLARNLIFWMNSTTCLILKFIVNSMMSKLVQFLNCLRVQRTTVYTWKGSDKWFIAQKPIKRPKFSRSKSA